MVTARPRPLPETTARPLATRLAATATLETRTRSRPRGRKRTHNQTVRRPRTRNPVRRTRAATRLAHPQRETRKTARRKTPRNPDSRRRLRSDRHAARPRRNIHTENTATQNRAGPQTRRLERGQLHLEPVTACVPAPTRTLTTSRTNLSRPTDSARWRIPPRITADDEDVRVVPARTSASCSAKT